MFTIKLFVIKIVLILLLTNNVCADDNPDDSPAVDNLVNDKLFGGDGGHQQQPPLQSAPEKGGQQQQSLSSETPSLMYGPSPAVTTTTTDNPSDVDFIQLNDKMGPFFQLTGHSPTKEASISMDNKKLFDTKQINQKHVQTRVALHQTLEAIYNCTEESALSLLSMSAEFDNYFVCNQVLDLRSDTKLNATIKGKSGNDQYTALTAYESNIQMVFFKGNQLYYTSARIDSGYCQGDKMTMLNVGLARKGGCNSRSGVKQIVSEYALLTITGRCRSTCFGDVNVALTPGVRN